MSSRDKILKAIKANKPAETLLPSAFSFESITGNLTEKYLQTLQGIGGTGRYLDGVGIGIVPTSEVANGIDFIEPYNLHDFADKTPAEIEKVQMCLLRGTIAVAENAAIWVPERNMINRLLPFLCQHLLIFIDEKDIVATMHDAYKKIKVDEDGYGAFIAGPSKTADIEQSLVIGAHGPVSLEVFIIKDVSQRTEYIHTKQ
jgi:L-lactate dehydrogenase complex protein LldG